MEAFPDRFRDQHLGVEITKPPAWDFLPSAWATSTRRRWDPEDEEVVRAFSLAQPPIVSAQFDHGKTDRVYPTLQLTARSLLQAVEPAAVLPHLQAQLENAFSAKIISATSDAVIAGSPSCRVVARYTLMAGEQLFEVYSQSFTIFTSRSLVFTLGLSGPADDEELEGEFALIVESLRIA